jgi:hypothetical protein
MGKGQGTFHYLFQTVGTSVRNIMSDSQQEQATFSASVLSFVILKDKSR